MEYSYLPIHTEINVAIRFQVTCSTTKLGQVVKLTGNTPQLGNWNAQNGLTMYTNEVEFPVWRVGALIDM
jgi:hypothetical protein